jgi:hypothetical protein
MESATFRKWLAKQGCRFDQYHHEQRHEGPILVTVHREVERRRFRSVGRARHSICGWSAAPAKNSGLIPRSCPAPRAVSKPRRPI